MLSITAMSVSTSSPDMTTFVGLNTTSWVILASTPMQTATGHKPHSLEVLLLLQ